MDSKFKIPSMAGQLKIRSDYRPLELPKTGLQDPIKELALNFIGRGQYKGFKFTQIHATGSAYVYSVDVKGAIYYHVFKKRINTRFGVISYPSPNSFGIWASCYYRDYDKALCKYNEINKEEEVI